MKWISFFLCFVLLFFVCLTPTCASVGIKKIAVIDFQTSYSEGKIIKNAVINSFNELLFLDENFSPLRDRKKILKAGGGKYDFSKKGSIKVGIALKVDYVIYGKVELKKGEIHVNAYTLDVNREKEIFAGEMFCVDISLLPQVTKRHLKEVRERIFWSEFVIITDPPGAKVYIEGLFKGNTPFKKNINPSTYSLKLQKGGFRTKSDVVTILKGERVIKKYKLSRVVYILSSPSGAKVYVDNRLWGTTPTTYYSERSILNMSWKKKGYASVEKIVDISSMKGRKKINANLIKSESIRFFESGLKKEEQFSEIYKEFIASKRGEVSQVYSGFFGGRFSDLFKETTYFFQSATLIDPNNGYAYFHLAKLYYQHVMLRLGSPIHVKSTILELMDFAAQSARIAVSLETDNKTTLESINLLGSLWLQRSKNSSNFTESLENLESAVGEFNKAIQLFDNYAEHDNDLANYISLYDNLHFNLSLCLEEIYKIKKLNKLNGIAESCKKSIKSWRSYDYLNIVNPENPFKPTQNPLTRKAEKHLKRLIFECSK